MGVQCQTTAPLCRGRRGRRGVCAFSPVVCGVCVSLCVDRTTDTTDADVGILLAPPVISPCPYVNLVLSPSRSGF